MAVPVPRCGYRTDARFYRSVRLRGVAARCRRPRPSTCRRAIRSATEWPLVWRPGPSVVARPAWHLAPVPAPNRVGTRSGPPRPVGRPPAAGVLGGPVASWDPVAFRGTRCPRTQCRPRRGWSPRRTPRRCSAGAGRAAGREPSPARLRVRRGDGANRGTLAPARPTRPAGAGGVGAGGVEARVLSGTSMIGASTSTGSSAATSARSSSGLVSGINSLQTLLTICCCLSHLSPKSFTPSPNVGSAIS